MRKLSIVAVVGAASLVATLGPVGTAVGQGGPVTTLDQTIVAEDERDLGYGPGEERVVLTLGWDDPGTEGRALTGFKQVSDIHVVDEESPGRVEFFDGCSFGSSAYRPQEAMSTQVGESMARALNGFETGPAVGANLGFTVSTGDNTDNNQRNELEWFLALLNGGTVAPDSGVPGYDGYTSEHHPDAMPTEILEMAQEQFEASGVGKWYAVLGNHDGLIQGNLPTNGGFEAIVTGDTKVFYDPVQYAEEDRCPPSINQAEEKFFELYLSDAAQEVPSDPSRNFMTHNEVVETYAGSGGLPEGHGLKNTSVDASFDGPAGYYKFKLSKDVIGISMDTIAYNNGSEGIINDSQFKWIAKQLKMNSKTYYDAQGEKRKNKRGENKLIVLFSHHTSSTINSPGTYSGASEEQIEAMLPQHCFTRGAEDGCEDGEGLGELINRFPNVIAWVNGHEHNNRVTPFPAPEGQDPARGFWEINTAAHIDWPQQSRLIEIAYEPGVDGQRGSVFIYGTVVDHLASPDPDELIQDPIEYLASLSRIESYYDACVREGQADCAAGGDAEDRNVKLVSKAPFKL
jgi:metallophosphoesterase (TIGR03767 family)